MDTDSKMVLLFAAISIVLTAAFWGAILGGVYFIAVSVAELFV